MHIDIIYGSQPFITFHVCQTPIAPWVYVVRNKSSTHPLSIMTINHTVLYTM